MIQLSTSTIDGLMKQALQLESRMQLADAMRLYGHVIAMNPNDAMAHRRLGTLFARTGKPKEAVAALRRAAELMPSQADIRNELAIALHVSGDLAGAVEQFERAIRLKGCSEFYNNMAISLQRLSRADEALAAFREAIRLTPGNADSHGNMASLLQGRGEIEQALAEYRRAVALAPGRVHHASYLFAMHFAPGTSPQEILTETRRWAALYADPLTERAAPFPREANRERPLRVGFVSPDFYQHPVARMLLPWIGKHDRSRIQITCYSCVLREDDMTAKIRAAVDGWQVISAMNDEQAEQMIRGQGIDILFDLSMHAAEARPLLFARKPAPVQAAWLAYCSTTGMRAMDWRLSDPYFDPPGSDESVYSEKTMRLPATYWCFGDPGVQMSPRTELRDGPVTFGCMNQFAKVSAAVLDTWARVLSQVPGSRMIIHAPEGSHRRRALEIFSRHGVSEDRIHFQARMAPEDYFRMLADIDIALDPFPYTGGMTTCDTLWMGTPVVTLRGRTAVGRGGVSLLSNVGLRELIADTVEEYVEKAVSLAKDPARLGEFRSTLRERLAASPVMDAQRFARDFEGVCRKMWHAWCDQAR